MALVGKGDVRARADVHQRLTGRVARPTNGAAGTSRLATRLRAAGTLARAEPTRQVKAWPWRSNFAETLRLHRAVVSCALHGCSFYSRAERSLPRRALELIEAMPARPLEERGRYRGSFVARYDVRRGRG